MEIVEECNQMYMYILEKNFVLLPQLKLYARTPHVYTKLYGRASFVFCHARKYRGEFLSSPLESEGSKWKLKIILERENLESFVYKCCISQVIVQKNKRCTLQ